MTTIEHELRDQRKQLQHLQHFSHQADQFMDFQMGYSNALAQYFTESSQDRVQFNSLHLLSCQFIFGRGRRIRWWWKLTCSSHLGKSSILYVIYIIIIFCTEDNVSCKFGVVCLSSFWFILLCFTSFYLILLL